MLVTPKRHTLARNRVFWRILRQNLPRGLGCSSELQEPKKTKKLTLFGAQSRVCAETKRLSGPWRTFAQLFERGSRRNHLCQFLWLSLTGFWRGRGGGQILGFSTDLRPRPSYCCTMKWMWRVTWQWKLKKSCRVTKNPHFSAEIQKPRRDQKNADLVGKTKSW